MDQITSRSSFKTQRAAALLGRRLSAVTISVLLLTATGCGGGAKTALKNGLKSSGFEDIQSIKGAGDESGQFTVNGENGSKVVLDVVKEGGKFVIDACRELQQNGSSCTDVPLEKRLEP